MSDNVSDLLQQPPANLLAICQHLVDRRQHLEEILGPPGYGISLMIHLLRDIHLDPLGVSVYHEIKILACRLDEKWNSTAAPDPITIRLDPVDDSHPNPDQAKIGWRTLPGWLSRSMQDPNFFEQLEKVVIFGVGQTLPGPP